MVTHDGAGVHARAPADEQERFLRAIFGDETGYLFICANDRAEPDPDKRWHELGSYVYPLQPPKVLERIREQDERGRDVYVAAQLYREPNGRRKDRVKGCPSAWSDADAADPRQMRPEASVILETSPGRFHAFWRLERPLSPTEGETLSLRIAYAYRSNGADPGGWDLTQVLRVPGTRNHKYDDRPTVRMLKCDPTPIPQEAFARLPQVPAAAVVVDADDDEDGPPVKLHERDLGWWDGTTVVEKGNGPIAERIVRAGEAGEVDRSDTLFMIGLVLAGKGAAKRTIIEALEDRDRALGYEAYTGRRDGGRGEYGRIADKVLTEPARLEFGRNGRTPGAAGEEDEDAGTLPAVAVSNRPLRDITRDAIGALDAANDPPEVYVRSGELARQRADERGRPIIEAATCDRLRGRLARVADWKKATKKGEAHTSPPEDVVKDVLAIGRWPFPPLEAITEAPVLRPDGSILDTRGYDAGTRLIYIPAAGLTVPAIPSDPTDDQIGGSLELIGDVIGDFPYVDAASYANALGLLLTPIVRPVISGNVPLALLDKPAWGTGASLLAEVASVVATGRPAAMMGAPGEEEEWRKAITTVLVEGATVVVIDNVPDTLRSAHLDRALTARDWKDRILGRTGSVTVPQRATWMATGNNLRVAGDLARRCYWIRLDAKMAKPWTRTDFAIADLLGWVTERRGTLLAALLTLARAWYAAGRPKAKVPTMGGFTAWAETVGGILARAGVPDFLGNLDQMYDQADEESGEWEEFLRAWSEIYGPNAVATAAVAERVSGLTGPLRQVVPTVVADAIAQGGSLARRLGKILAKRDGTRFGADGIRLEQAAPDHSGRLRWRVVTDG